MRLAAFLLLLILATHYLPDVLALQYEDQDAASRIIFYRLRGMEGAALFAALGFLIRRPLVQLACGWGFAEELQTATCSLDGAREMFTGLCGKEPYLAGIVMAAVLAYLIARRLK